MLRLFYVKDLNTNKRHAMEGAGTSPYFADKKGATALRDELNKHSIPPDRFCVSYGPDHKKERLKRVLDFAFDDFRKRGNDATLGDITLVALAFPNNPPEFRVTGRDNDVIGGGFGDLYNRYADSVERSTERKAGDTAL